MPVYPQIGQVKAGLLGIQPLIAEPEIRKQLVNIYRDNDFINFLDMMDVWSPTKNERYYNYTEDPLTSILDTTGMTVATSGTTTVTLTVVPTGTMMVGQLYKCVSGAQANIAVGRVQTVTTGATDTVVLKSVNAVVLTITAGDKLTPAGNAQEEGSGAVGRNRWSLTPLTNQVQVFKKSVSSTDIAKGKYYRVNFTGADGQKMGGLVSYEQMRGYMLHRTEMAQAFWSGEAGTSFFEDISGAALTGANGNAVQATRGIEGYIRTYGSNTSLAAPNTFSNAEFTAFSNALDAVNGSDHYLLTGGNPAVLALTNYLKNLGSSGVTSVRMNVDDREIDMMVERWTLGGRTFDIKRMNAFDNTQYFSTGAAVAKSLYAIPIGKVGTKEGGLMPYLGVRYMPMKNAGVGDGKIGEYHTGMLAASGPTSENSEEAVTFQSIAGIEVLAPQTFAKWTVL